MSGSVLTGRGWFAPILQLNSADRPIDLLGRPNLQKDILGLHKKFGIQIFLYGPPLWMFGKPPEEDGKQRWNTEDLDFVCQSFEEKILNGDDIFFRVQTNIQESPEDSRFCSPPNELRKQFGRFDSENISVLYCSFDVETCLHESRVSLEDEIFVAAVAPSTELRVLDLTVQRKNSSTTPFEDPRIWLRSLLYDHSSYEACREIAQHIDSLGYDGFIAESYFQQAADSTHRNLCLFGRPIKSGKIRVIGLNRVNLRNVRYEFGYGPGIFSNEVWRDDDGGSA